MDDKPPTLDNTTVPEAVTGSGSGARSRLLRRMAPPFFLQPGVEKIVQPAILSDNQTFPSPSFTTYRQHATSMRRMPQCIAHRGFRAMCPENTMLAFDSAVRVGAHALEMDVHLTKDHVVVISHDATLRRCFGRKEKIIDCNWEELEPLRTIAKPHEPMPRLLDVLEYLSQPGHEHIWILLDIKLDNDTDNVMRLLSKTIDSVTPVDNRPWRERIVLGIWAVKYLPVCAQYLPDFPVTHIGFLIAYARNFFEVPNVSFNIAFPFLAGPGGRKFLRDAQQKYNRQVYSWTVNAEDRMEWCIRHNLDGVITDNPELFLKVCDRFESRLLASSLGLTWRSYAEVYRFWFWISVAAFVFHSKLAPVASKSLISKRSITL